MNTKQQILPLTLTESRQARLARVLALTAGKVQPAAAFTFTSKAAREAEQRAQGGTV